ncbi:MAG: hypothetical protein HCA25_00935 [Dolichospermum sp. DET50]|nr:hypothetical protein [Dolichospermum sp. DET66]MBS3030883.1 hypothetical protein [Dolichospermum sp. DET67]MBS3036093.1 hypothetical protein [Dolichospermum sp. DET50]QSX68170.1 MAG: hypothetical protein EZY12_00105 [Dolichospermum sp. DET69]
MSTFPIVAETVKVSALKAYRAIANLFTRSILEDQYQVISKKITEQFDAKWLETLETEDDLLEAAVELTKHE